MPYGNKVSAVVAVLFLAVAIGPRLAESQTETPTFPKMTPECAEVLPDLLEMCFRTVTPTEECCSDLKSATTIEVTCLCDNYIAHPDFVNFTKPYADKITTKCGTFDKFSCGTTKGEEDDGSRKSTKEGNGGKANKVTASMTVFGLLASLFFVMF